MRKCSSLERYKFEELMKEHIQTGRLNPDHLYRVGAFARRLMRYGATLGRLAEEQCNGYQTIMGNEDEKRARASERKEERIKAKVTVLCEQFGCKAVFQSDPRGATLKIAVPDGYTDDLRRGGICVPTS